MGCPKCGDGFPRAGQAVSLITRAIAESLVAAGSVRMRACLKDERSWRDAAMYRCPTALKDAAAGSMIYAALNVRVTLVKGACRVDGIASHLHDRLGCSQCKGSLML